ncbi:START-like domain [Ceraceosorus bombacis]|uniref:START-like domain n=1 Tax=Ceraceosorus bombacis TaxID=401625 RepID=A0A0P1BHE1_9BASI|nr:START-like domain [Ceraceosorus bombacis]
MATFTTTTTTKGNGKATVHYVDAESSHSGQSPPYHEAMSVSVASSSATSSPQIASNPKPFRIPISPAPHGYQLNKWASDVAISHQIMDHVLNPKVTPPDKWEDCGIFDDGVQVSWLPRRPEQISFTHMLRGQTYIADCSPEEILHCIHILSFRLIWDVRIGAAGIISRFSQFSFLFYFCWRGIGQAYKGRDVTGVQGCRFLDGEGREQVKYSVDTNQIDIVWRSVELPDVPATEEKVRARIPTAGYRIERAGRGCNVTFIGQADLGEVIPGYLLRTLCHEQPRGLGRLRTAIESFGVPPYICDQYDCAVIQLQVFYPETRKTTVRAHASRAGTFALVLDVKRMYRNGVLVTKLAGEGASSLNLQDGEDRLLMSIAPSGVGKEFFIEIEPRDSDPEVDQSSGWW